MFAILHRVFFRTIKMFFNSNRSADNPIVIISFKNLGDTVFTLSALRYLSEKWVGEIYLFCYEESEYIYSNSLNGFRLKVFKKHEMDLFRLLPPLKIVREVNRLRPYAAIDLTAGIPTSLLVLFSRATYKYGFGNQKLGVLFDNYFPYRSYSHLMDMYGNTVSLFLKEQPETFHIEFPVNYKTDDIILVNPFAGWAAKMWGIKKYIRLVELLNENYEVALIFQKGELSAELIDYLVWEKLKYTETNSIEDLVNAIRNCSIFIGNDSGPLNLATLIGKPTFTIYGPTNPKFSMPKHPIHRYIQKQIKCSPAPDKQNCFTLGGLYCPAYECMHQLSVKEVYDAVVKTILDLNIQTLKTINNVNN